MLDHLRDVLARPVGGAPLRVWRFLFGALMLAESWGAIATGWVRRTLVEPRFTFNFIGLDFLQPLPGWGMYAYFFAMGCAALGVALAWRYRVSAVALAVLWSGAYLMQKTSYNNHYYLAVLLCWWMALLPPEPVAHPYAITLFARLQLLVVFVYGAVAKLYPGWYEGRFIEQAFGAKTGYPLIGPLLGEAWFQDFITYSAIAFDALVIPALWYRPTRRLAVAGLLVFNLFNSVVFQIGIFPYLVLAFTVFFFDPAWVARFLPARARRELGSGGAESAPTASAKLPAWVPGAFAAYFAVQLLLPLRHHLIPGDVNWREEGHRMSWRMMLRAKSGSITLEAVNPRTGERELVDQGEWLTPKQCRRVGTRPDFVWQFAQRLRRYYLGERGWPAVELYATRSRVWLNGEGPYPMIDPRADLAAVDFNYWGRNDWVLDQPERGEPLAD